MKVRKEDGKVKRRIKRKRDSIKKIEKERGEMKEEEGKEWE